MSKCVTLYGDQSKISYYFLSFFVTVNKEIFKILLYYTESNKKRIEFCLNLDWYMVAFLPTSLE